MDTIMPMNPVDEVQEAIQAYQLQAIQDRRNALEIIDELISDSQPGQRINDDIRAFQPLAKASTAPPRDK